MILKLASLLSPNADPFITALAGYLSTRTGIEVAPVDHLHWRERERMLDRGEAHLGFLCGLYYVRKLGRSSPSLELLAAPVMRGDCYGGRPVYFSEVVVRRDSAYRSFDDLRGGAWSFNEPRSHSGYNVVRFHLARLGLRTGYFGSVVEAGSHLSSLEKVLAGAVCASAIDSTVLDLERRFRPELDAQLRTVAVLGPSAIPPAVIRSDVPAAVRRRLREALLDAHGDEDGRRALDAALVERFVGAKDEDYHDIRRMARVAKGVRLAAATALRSPRWAVAAAR